MTPFKLTLELATPFYLSSRLTLDGLLSAAIHHQTGKMGADTLAAIPLDQDQGIFRGSSLFCHPRYRHRRFSRIMSLKSERDLHTELFQPNKRGDRYGVVDQQRGKFKANLDSYFAIEAKEVYFWGVGDSDQTCYLIENYIHGIGKRANTGAGEILSVRAEETDDFSWVTRKGKPARPLPVEIWNDMGLAPASTAPLAVVLPYWGTAPVDAVFPATWEA
ncbi:hypothetical protein [Parachitinimonas caeni]|uniref:Uncharacterized protein n=1 Tax=Parachitinimonas caeni TaxID=3031301 RepID=A0ABT7E4G3_9NEIS|nr:hypothetical protein [Parachitinimonas caeni]MDK2126248.1 hypothetical protein [Parachitinimonas caeni]